MEQNLAQSHSTTNWYIRQGWVLRENGRSTTCVERKWAVEPLLGTQAEEKPRMTGRAEDATGARTPICD